MEQVLRLSRLCFVVHPEGDPMIRTRVTLAALLIAAVSAVAVAQAPSPPVRIRGTVEKIDGTKLTIKANNGQSMNVKLADNYTVMGIAKASLADIAGGKFIGTTTLGERNGALVALEVQYKGGEKKVLVPEKAVIVSFTPTERSALKPGAPVFAVTQRQPDGSLTAARVNVGLKGQVPPM